MQFVSKFVVDYLQVAVGRQTRLMKVYGLDETEDNIKYIARVVREFRGVGFMSSYKFIYDQSCDSVFFLVTDEEDANSTAGLMFRVGDDGLRFFRVMNIMVVGQHSDEYSLELWEISLEDW